MADVETKKGRGRPRAAEKKEKQPEKVEKVEKAEKAEKVEEPKKRSSTAAANDNDTNGDVPAKRGRGRPPKGAKKTAARPKAAGRGPGRPKNIKKKEESEEEEEDEVADSHEEEEEEEEESS